MNFKVSINGEEANLAISGNIDVVAAGSLKKSLLEILKDSRIHEVIFDFREVAFLGSSGVGTLLLFYKNFTANKANRITFKNLNDEITELFKVLKLDQLFHILEN